MTLIELFNVLRRRGWIILLLAALTALSAFAFSKLQTPVYQASVRILVQPSRPDLGLTSSAKNLLRSYVEWMKTRQNAQQVIEQLSLDRLPDSLLGDVTIASEDENFVIEIDVRNQNGDLANDIARTWADLFVQWRDIQNQDANREDWVKAMVLDSPDYVLYRPQTVVNVLAGAILGLLLGGGIIFALEYLEANILRSSQDTERGLGLTVLGAIPTLEQTRRK